MQTLRRFLRAPVFTLIALLTLAIGIGANTAIFSVVDSILLRPLQWQDSERLVGLWHASAKLEIPKLNMNPALYFTYREQNRSFESLGLWTPAPVNVTQLGEPEQVRSLFVTEGTLTTLRVQPIAGRSFSEKDTAEGSPHTVMLTYGYWQRRFGGAASTLHRQLIVDGESSEIIGILPRDFRFMDQKADLLLPLRLDRGKILFGNFSYRGIARLRPGVTLARANADVTRMIPLSMAAFPPPPGFTMKIFEDAHVTANVMSLKQDLVGDIGDLLWVLMGTVGAVLLIACANVANLLLVRAESRQHEFAVRAALGAGWQVLARDLMAESVVLGLAGGLLGTAVAWGALRGLVAMGPESLPRLNEISINGPALLFTFAISLLCGLLFGILPVVRYAGVRIGTGLRESGRSLSHSRARIRARNVLVVVQVALALVLLICSGLTIRTFQSLRHVDPGFRNPETVLTFHVAIPDAVVKDPERVTRMYGEIVTKIRQLPGVSSAALTSSVTMDGNDNNDVLYAEGHAVDDGRIPPIRRFKNASPEYFATLGNPLLAGRDMTWEDSYQMRPVAIVSESLAREYWGSAAVAVGKRIREGKKDEWREVVGVVGDEYDDGPQRPVVKTVYWPMLMKNFQGSEVRARHNMVVVVRSPRTGTPALLDEVRRAVWSVSSASPVADVQTLDEIYRKSMARTSFMIVMLAMAGGMALLLGLIGIYGVIAYSVSQRRHEIGIRMALGARHAAVSGMFVQQGAVMAGIGVACGLTAAAGLTRLMKSMLFGVSPLDPLTYVFVAAGLMGAVVVASYIPARRAAAVDPMETLRGE